jgi:AraC family transcriptional regulator
MDGMEAFQRFNESITYIEDHLDREIDIDEVAAVACVSKFHYHRMFNMLTGFTTGEYIRNRRLTLAAQELSGSQSKVIDVALKYGYETPESFSKAFRRAHGVSPSQVKVQGIQLKAFPRLSFQIQLKGAEEMNYKIEERPSFKVIGNGIHTSMANGENQKNITNFWIESHQNGSVKELERHMGDLGVLGVCMDFDHEAEEITYLIAVEKGESEVDKKYIEKEIPAATWAIFESIGAMPDAIQNVWDRIYSEWFPSTGYEQADGPQLEVYPAEDAYADDYRCQVWIPIKKK